jgi:FG-GAP-like repeat/FG-GAP repeat
LRSKPYLALLVFGLAAANSDAVEQQNRLAQSLGADALPNFPNQATKGLVARPEVAPLAPAQLTFTVTFDDPAHTYSAYYAEITSAVQAAGAEWARYLMGSAQLAVQVSFDSSRPTANGGSFTTGFVRNDGTRDIYEQGATYELKTGTDPNGASPDIQLIIGTTYLTQTLWFDPHPMQRTDPIPANRLDAISVFTHELGHAFVFNGWMNGTTGELPPAYMSTFDANVHFDGTNFYFVGQNAEGVHGGPVPITYADPFHLGNNPPRPGSNLIPDLMNGVVYYYQTRYRISALDVEIGRDAGAPVISLSHWILQNPGTQQSAIWWINDGQLLHAALSRSLPPGWSLVDADDFGGPTTSPDFLLFNPATRATAIWYMNGSTYLQAGYGPTLPQGWTVVLSHDFNGDNKPDLLLYQPSTGSTAIWYLSGGALTGGDFAPTLPAGWRVVAAADFDGDQKTDLLIYNASSRNTAIWYLHGASFAGGVLGPVLPAGYVPIAVDDLNHDGKPDLVLSNPTTHQTAIWHLNNNSLTSGLFGPTLPSGWMVAAPK